MPTFETHDRARLAYSDRGVGPAVVFLSSWSFAGRSWDYQTVPLAAEGYRCVTLDRRGHGRSEDPGQGYEMDCLADDVGTLLERLNLMDAALVGFSVGCAEAVRTATRYADRIGKLVLIGTTTPLLSKTEDHPEGIDPAYFAAFQDQLLSDYPNWIDENIDPFAPTASRGMKDWIRSMALDNSLYALLELNRTLTKEDFRSELPRIGAPTLLIHGDQDVTCPLSLTGRPTAALIPGAQIKVYEGAAHGLPYTHTERINADLLAFLRS